MIKVSYHLLGALLFGLGLLLVIKLPFSNSLIGDYFFGQYFENTTIIKLVGTLLQLVGILLFMEWFKEHGKKRYVEKWKKYGLIIVILLLLLAPLLINKIIDSIVKTYVYAGEEGIEAIEIIQSDRFCKVDSKQQVADCTFSLKNYNNTSQRVNVQLYWDKETKTSWYPLYLVRHQEKRVHLRIPLKPKELRKLTREGNFLQPQIILK
jgi:hypothetical protein